MRNLVSLLENKKSLEELYNTTDEYKEDTSIVSQLDVVKKICDDLKDIKSDKGIDGLVSFLEGLDNKALSWVLVMSRNSKYINDIDLVKMFEAIIYYLITKDKNTAEKLADGALTNTKELIGAHLK